MQCGPVVGELLTMCSMHLHVVSAQQVLNGGRALSLDTARPCAFVRHSFDVPSETEGVCGVTYRDTHSRLLSYTVCT